MTRTIAITDQDEVQDLDLESHRYRTARETLFPTQK